MRYNMLHPLADDIGLFNLFRYITRRTGGAVVTARFVSFIFGPMVRKKCNCDGARPVLHLAVEGKLQGQEPQLFDWNAWKNGDLAAE